MLLILSVTRHSTLTEEDSTIILPVTSLMDQQLAFAESFPWTAQLVTYTTSSTRCASASSRTALLIICGTPTPANVSVMTIKTAQMGSIGIQFGVNAAVTQHLSFARRLMKQIRFKLTEKCIAAMTASAIALSHRSDIVKIMQFARRLATRCTSAGNRADVNWCPNFALRANSGTQSAEIADAPRKNVELATTSTMKNVAADALHNNVQRVTLRITNFASACALNQKNHVLMANTGAPRLANANACPNQKIAEQRNSGIKVSALVLALLRNAQMSITRGTLQLASVSAAHRQCVELDNTSILSLAAARKNRISACLAITGMLMPLERDHASAFHKFANLSKVQMALDLSKDSGTEILAHAIASNKIAQVLLIQMI